MYAGRSMWLPFDRKKNSVKELGQKPDIFAQFSISEILDELLMHRFSVLFFAVFFRRML